MLFNSHLYGFISISYFKEGVLNIMQNFLFLINILVSLCISIFIFINFINNNKRYPELKKIFFLFFVIGFIFLLYSVVFTLWFFNLTSYSPEDFLLVHSILVSIEAILLLLMIYNLRKNKKIFYLFFIYLIFILSVIMGWNFSNFLLLSSLMLILILFILFISVPSFTRISKFAIFYCSISLLLEITFLFKNQPSPIISLISNVFFFLFILFFLIDLKNIQVIVHEKKLSLKKNYYIFDFLRYFIFIVILTNFVFVGTLAIHEAGHFFVSKLTTDCNLERIIYDGTLPHTEILCEGSIVSISKIIFGGIFLPVLVAFLFFFGGGTFMKEISLLIIGFDILIAYKDFIDLGFSQTLSTFFSMFGAGIVILAILILAKSRTTEEDFIHLTDS